MARVGKTQDEFLTRVEGWLSRRKPDYLVPATVEQAVVLVRARRGGGGVPAASPGRPGPVRLVVDTNALIDCSNVAAYTDQLGRRYRAHLMPVVLGELDDLKRSRAHTGAARRSRTV